MNEEYETGADGLRVRQLRACDEEALVALNAYGLTAAGVPSSSDYYSGADMANMELTYGKEGGGLMLVGEVDRKIVAMGGIRRVDVTTCEILRMRVYPEYQGRGFGSAILELLEREAMKWGYHRATLITGENQHPAIDLYTRHGYDIMRREMLIGIPSVHMSKSLAESE